MGLMYWQFNDIWQTTTGSTIEYGLRWKMSHYYAKYMYEPVYPIVILTPYLANITDENARISIYVISDLFTEIHAQLICSTFTMNSFSPLWFIAFDIILDFSTVQHVTDIPYAKYMKDARPCVLNCLLKYNGKQISQTLFPTQPKNYQLQQPNLRVRNLTQISLTEISFAITAVRPALFVWLNVPTNRSGYFSENGFHIFEPIKPIQFHSWMPINDFKSDDFDLRIISLFDITQL